MTTQEIGGHRQLGLAATHGGTGCGLRTHLSKVFPLFKEAHAAGTCFQTRIRANPIEKLTVFTLEWLLTTTRFEE